MISSLLFFDSIIMFSSCNLCEINHSYMAYFSGVDVVPILEYLQINEKFINMIRNSSASDWLMTYALYKLFTPIRYTVTVGELSICIYLLAFIVVKKN